MKRRFYCRDCKRKHNAFPFFYRDTIIIEFSIGRSIAMLHAEMDMSAGIWDRVRYSKHTRPSQV